MTRFNYVRSVNLAERNSDGISVSLDFDPVEKEIAVTVCTADREDFVLYPPNHLALDCFYHPFAFAHRALMSGRIDKVSS